MRLLRLLGIVACAVAALGATCVRYERDPGVSDEDAQRIKNGIDWAIAYVDANFEGSRQAPVVVLMNDEPHECFGNLGGAFGPTSGFLCLNTSLPSWEFQEEKTAAHEYVHALQWEMRCGVLPNWLEEGAAEWIAYEVVIDNGRLSRQFVEAERINRLVDYYPDVIGTLQGGEETTPSTAHSYKLYEFAFDHLVRDKGLLSYRRYCERVAAGEDWRVAFEATWGSLADFYERIDQNVRELERRPNVPPN